MNTNSEALFDSLQTAIVLIDHDWRITYLNSSAQELLKSSTNQLISKLITNFFENPTLVETCLSRLNRLNQQKSMVIKEIALFRASGERIIVTCALNYISDQDNFASIELIQETRFSLFNQTPEPGSTELSSDNDLIQGMAHEIKNPLGGIRGAAQLLAANLSHREDKDFVNIIIHETDRLTALVDRMSGYIKDKNLLPLNIHKVLEHVYQLILNDKAADIRIKRDYDPSLPDILGSQESLIQAFLNLGLNALNALDTKGEIVIRSRLVYGLVMNNQLYRQAIKIDIQDNGSGIDSRVADKLFEPLVTTRPQGTGLGLSITREIINAHYGTISARSKAGLTTFTAYFPIIEN